MDRTPISVDEGRFPLCRPDRLVARFRGAGLARVEVRGIAVPTAFRDFDDYWSLFLGGQAPAPGYCRSLDAPDGARRFEFSPRVRGRSKAKRRAE